MGITTFKEKRYLSFTWGSKKLNNTTRNQNYGDFKSNPALGERKHKKLKYPVKGKMVTVQGEEEYMVSHLNSFRYVDNKKIYRIINILFTDFIFH